MPNIIDKLKETKNQYKDIKQLLKDKKYDEIFEKYGREIYARVIPPKVKKAEIKRLLEKGRYEDIYRKFGEKVYNSHLIQMRKNDVQTETGSKYKGSIEEFKYWLKIKFAPILLSAGLLFSSSMPVLISTTAQSIKRENEIEYSEEIEEYNEHLKEYAKEIQSLNLTDTQIFVKLMYDLLNEIEDYRTPKKYYAYGIDGMAVEKEKVGLPINVSANLADKLNAINPDFKAKSLPVYLSKTKNRFSDTEEIKQETDKNDNNIKNTIRDTIIRELCSYSSLLTRKRVNFSFRSN